MSDRLRDQSARDSLDRLFCQVPGCRSTISGQTGLQEIIKLIHHMRRAHLVSLSAKEALDLREKWESKFDKPDEKDA